MTAKRPSLFSDIQGKWCGRTLRRGYINSSLPGKCSPWSRDRLQYSGVGDYLRRGKKQNTKYIRTRIYVFPPYSMVDTCENTPYPSRNVGNVCTYHELVQMVESCAKISKSPPAWYRMYNMWIISSWKLFLFRAFVYTQHKWNTEFVFPPVGGQLIL